MTHKSKPTMEFPLNRPNNSSPSSSNSSSTPNPLAVTAATPSSNAADDPVHSWWESVSKARSFIHSLASILPSSSDSLITLADSDRPALSLLSSQVAYSSVAEFLSSPLSGSGSDPLCHWLYDTFLAADPHLRLVVFSYLPLLSGLYLSRIHSNSSDSLTFPSLAGFEAVLLALYASETKSRAGKPVLVTIPDLSQPSLYHTPRNKPASGGINQSRPSVGVLSPPLEPQVAVKSTKRAGIVGVALDCYYKQISQMPSWSKLEFCQFAASWAGQDCPCTRDFDKGDEIEIDGFSDRRDLDDGDEIEDVAEDMGRRLVIQSNGFSSESPPESLSKGSRIPLPWELLQPALRILGHCLLAPLNSQDVRDAASIAVRSLYARASHDLVPQAILASRSLIQLDKRSRDAAKVVVANSSSNANTPSKAKKPEVLLVSK